MSIENLQVVYVLKAVTLIFCMMIQNHLVLYLDLFKTSLARKSDFYG